MIDLRKFDPTRMKSQHRLLVWVLLILLTLIILLFPVKLINEYHPIQAPYIITNPPLFIMIFVTWLILILLLVLSKKNDQVFNWEFVALSMVFGLIFVGFWCFVSPNGSSSDDLYAMGHVHYLLDIGKIPVNHPLFSYFDFPGMFSLVTVYSQISNLSIFVSRMLFLLFNTGLFFILLYLRFSYSLRRAHLAFLGVMLAAIIGTTIAYKMSIFTPGALGFTLLLILLMIQKKKNFTSYAQRPLVVLELLVYCSMVISYFATSLLFPLIMLVVYVVTIIGKKRISLTIQPLALCLVIFFVWQLWFTWHTTSSLIQFFPYIIRNIKTGNFLSGLLIFSGANVGGNTPLWATVIRLFCWGLLLLFTTLAFRNLFIIKKLTTSETMDTSGWLGVLIFSIIGLIGVTQGTQFARYLLYAPFFTVPVMLNFLNKSRWRKTGLVILTCISFLLILPAFMIAINTSKQICPHDIDAGIFFSEHTLNGGSNIIIYRASTTSASWAYYYLPETSFQNIPEATYYHIDEFWEKVNMLVATFGEIQHVENKDRIFIVDEQMYNSAEHMLGITPNDPRWSVLQNNLSNQLLFYDNGFIQTYTAHGFVLK